MYRPKEDTDQQEEAVGETEEADNAEHIVTNQTDSLDSTTLEIQSSPGGKADSLLAKDDTFPELRCVHYNNVVQRGKVKTMLKWTFMMSKL